MSVLFLLARRTWQKTFRRPVLLSFSLVQPIVWLLLFGFLFERALPPRFGNLRYLDFLAPGVGAMTVLFGASQSGIAWIRDLQTGFLTRLLRSPTSPSLILLGKLGADTLRLFVQALVVLLIASAMGARIAIDLALLPCGVAALLLFAFAFSTLSSVIALATGAQEAMAAYVHIVNMPLLFTSTALIPRAGMPDWLASISRWNPLTLAVDAWRGALLLGRAPHPLATIAVLGGICIALFVIALAALQRAARRAVA